MFTHARGTRFLPAILVVALIGALLLFSPTVLASPLTTQSLAQGKTAQDLANSLLGGGITISNVTYVGKDVAAGSFGGGADVVGFEGGIILSSGQIAGVVGTNSGSNVSTNNGTPGDANLNTLTQNGLTTNDAAVLAFDFVPTLNQVSFQYVFASEEYNEYVNSSYNDVFGFFVNGTNCALVNGQPVSINTINKGTDGISTGTNGQYFINNMPPPGGTIGPLNTTMDGLTTVLTCQATVNQGATNHMKLAVADTSDSAFDTNVFIKGGSFSVVSPSPSPGNPACLSPASLDFGNQVVGSSAPSQLALLNNCGSVPLTITSVTLGGTNPGDFEITSSCAGSTIAVGASCGIRVIFHPAALGGRSATVTAAFSGGTATLTLTGTGINPDPPYYLTLLNVGSCSFDVSSVNGVQTNITNTTLSIPQRTNVTLTPRTTSDWTFIYWKSERGFMGWADPWTFLLNADHTVTIYCVPTPSFPDYTPSSPTKNDPIIRMAALQIIRGYENGYFGPNDNTLRAQMAALIARGMGYDRVQTWDQENHGNPFPDQGPVDVNLWRNVGTLYYYNVARGYQDGTYRPLGDVLYAQTISFITRAMVLNGYWEQQPDNPSIYPNVPADSGHRSDIVTYVHYAGALPGTSSTTQVWSIWDRASTRVWFSQAEWLALNSYFGVSSRFAP